MLRKIIHTSVAMCFLLAAAQMSFAGVSPDEAAKLKTTLTPLGAEKAGNSEGTISAWDGGYTTLSPNYKSGDRRPDPFADERPLFSITSENMEQYADKLPEGQKVLLKKYPLNRMDVYPSHRTASAPEYVYQNTFRNATRATTINNGLTVQDAYGGIPFPIPKDGMEAMWNHLLAWKGVGAHIPFRIYIVTPSGKSVLAVEAVDDTQFPYYYPDVPIEEFGGYYFLLRQVQTAPPFKAGESILVWDPVDVFGKRRSAWQYLVGQRRVRRAPNIAYDTPDFVASGQEYFDEVFVFNGAMDRYEWQLLGKREMFVPYNCNKFYLQKRDADIIGAGQQFLNPDHVRWELHRVWVVEATLAKGKRHVIHKRRFYLDEDTWLALMYDGWDGRGQLWRFTISLLLIAPEFPGLMPNTFTVHNLLTGGRVITDVINEMPVQYQKAERRPESFYTPEALAGTGVR